MNKCVVSFLSENMYLLYVKYCQENKNENICAALKELIAGDIFIIKLLTKYQIESSKGHNEMDT